jgi:phosphoglycerate kinase
MNLPSIENADLSGKKVLVRADVDLGEEIVPDDKTKLETLLPTIRHLLDKNAKVVILGHRGRPEGKVVEELSLKPVAEMLSQLLDSEVSFINELYGGKVTDGIDKLADGEILMLENLRFDAREEENDEGFANELSELGEVYVNEAFSVCHREHASIVGIPKFLPHYAGLHLIKEIENLTKAREDPQRPVVVILSGLKEDKLDYIPDFLQFADKILIAGRLPEYIENNDKFQMSNSKLIVARLLPDKEDITMHSIEEFEAVMVNAKTIIVSGPVGKFEEQGHRQGTDRVFNAVANCEAFKVAGGGDTAQAVKLLGLQDKFDWISVGGGASLQFLAKGTLPGIDVLKT